MTIDQLRYFQAVCTYDSISRAAEILNISQPSISNAIANLENEFGVKLFTRYHKRLKLTDEGNILVKYFKNRFTRLKKTALYDTIILQ